MIAELTRFDSHATWYGNLHIFVPYPWILFILIGASTVCGTLIGQERRSRHKPVGMRTVTLICLGSTIFTLVSILMSRSAEADPGRIAAQVVTGIGFLGAGTILHTSGQVKGLTTAATIWAVAAIGVLIGAGYVIPGIGISLFVLALLRVHSQSEDRARRARDRMNEPPPSEP